MPIPMDIRFTFNATNYDYMLATDANGRKRWSVQQLFTQPPSLLKNKIDMVVKAAPKVRIKAGTVDSTRTIGNVLPELRTLADKVVNMTLTGLDEQTYKVLFDKAATNARSVIDETGRIIEYEIDISCWDMYE